MILLVFVKCCADVILSSRQRRNDINIASRSRSQCFDVKANSINNCPCMVYLNVPILRDPNEYKNKTKCFFPVLTMFDYSSESLYRVVPIMNNKFENQPRTEYIRFVHLLLH